MLLAGLARGAVVAHVLDVENLEVTRLHGLLVRLHAILLADGPDVVRALLQLSVPQGRQVQNLFTRLPMLTQLLAYASLGLGNSLRHIIRLFLDMLCVILLERVRQLADLRVLESMASLKLRIEQPPRQFGAAMAHRHLHARRSLLHFLAQGIPPIRHVASLAIAAPLLKAPGCDFDKPLWAELA